jgi:hypothetical protein
MVMSSLGFDPLVIINTFIQKKQCFQKINGSMNYENKKTQTRQNTEVDLQIH